MKVFQASAIKQIDQYTIEHEPVSSIDLMERAATELCMEITARWNRNTPFVVFAGPGNNGGDSLALARLLHGNGYRVECFLFNPLNRLSVDCETNRQRLAEQPGIRFTEVDKDFDPPELNGRTVVIDGLFGTGLSKPLSGGYASVVQYINESDATVVAVDIPSGLFAEDNRENNHKNIVRAHLTLTLQFPKLAFFFADNYPYVGEWSVLNIKLHPHALEQTPSNIHYQTLHEMGLLVKTRPKFGHKGDYGHALLMAGSRGMMGAALLTTGACLRSGAGRVTLHTSRCGYEMVQTTLPEAMVSVDDQDNTVSYIDNLSRFDAIGVGPGLGQSGPAAEALGQLLRLAKVPCVIDADALNLLAANKELMHHLPKYSILTPHPKELARLAEEESTEGYNRLLKAYDLAKTYDVIVVLKGAHTAIVSPGGECWFNSTGNPGMATGGSGDVLTGLLTALLAQGYSPIVAARLGVYLHGLAGDLALTRQSEESLLAHDLIDHLGQAFKQLKEQ